MHEDRGGVRVGAVRRSTIVLAATIALGVMLPAGTAWAHHNMSASFDFNQRFTVTGTLARSDWRNPHIELSVDAKNDRGEMQTWRFEGPSPNVFRNLNVDKTDVANAIGKTVTVEASRARDGSLWGLIRIITLPDGRWCRYVRKIADSQDGSRDDGGGALCRRVSGSGGRTGSAGPTGSGPNR